MQYRELIVLVLVVAAWYALNKWVLPYFGVAT